MSRTLRIIGNLEDVRAALTRVKQVIDRRKSEGFNPWMHEFTYEYRTKRDGRVCPRCADYDEQPFQGDEIKSTFPAAFYESDGVIHPRTHDQPGFPAYIQRRDKNAGEPDYGCGCRLHLLNKAEGAEMILHREKEAAV